MNISVIGCGRWGTFIAWYLHSIGKNVTLYGREDSKHFNQLLNTHSNGVISLNQNIKLSSSIKDTLNNEVIIISVPSQSLRDLLNDISKYNIDNKTFVLCMKGLEIETGYRLTQVFDEVIGPRAKVAVWLGPGHVQEFLSGIPNCMVIDSESQNVKTNLVSEFKGPLIRFYYGNDIIGNEIGAATKNVIGIAAGILDGLNLSSLKGALMSRGTREIARLISSLGGNELSAYGLCHLGDYEATVFSKYSHNRQFGESFAKGENFDSLAEGYFTVKAVKKILETNSTELPICEAVYNVLYEKKNTKDEIEKLFDRKLKVEF